MTLEENTHSRIDYEWIALSVTTIGVLMPSRSIRMSKLVRSDDCVTARSHVGGNAKFRESKSASCGSIWMAAFALLMLNSLRPVLNVLFVPPLVSS